MRQFTAVIMYEGEEVLRVGPTDLTRARLAIADWKSENQDKDMTCMCSWLETMSVLPYLPKLKTKRWEGKAEHEKIIEKYEKEM